MKNSFVNYLKNEFLRNGISLVAVSVFFSLDIARSS
jgi:hypothetical protein